MVVLPYEFTYKVLYTTLGRFLIYLLEYGDYTSIEVSHPFCSVRIALKEEQVKPFQKGLNSSFQAFCYE